MLDLSRPAVEEWLKQNEPEKHPFVAVAASDDAAVASDGDAPVVALGKLLAASAAAGPEKLAAYLGSDTGAKLFAEILSQLDPARILLLFDWLMNSGLPDGEMLLGRIVTAASPAVQTYLKALLAETERGALAARLFSPARLERLQAACEPQAMRSAA